MRSSSWHNVLAPPNQRLIRRKSASEAVTSAWVPASESRSSATTVRFIWPRLDLRQLFFEQLLVVKVGVVSAARDQLIMRAELDDAAAVEHSDAVRIAYGGDAVRDEHGGAA